LDPGLDSVFVENGRIMYYQPDAYSYSPFSHADADSGSQSDANANANAESRHGMQRDSDLDCERDLYGRPAGEPERLHL
jgi:hypothetical protein